MSPRHCKSYRYRTHAYAPVRVAGCPSVAHRRLGEGGPRRVTSPIPPEPALFSAFLHRTRLLHRGRDEVGDLARGLRSADHLGPAAHPLQLLVAWTKGAAHGL